MDEVKVKLKTNL